MAQGTIMPAPWFTGLDDSGNPLSGGLLYTYAAGTTTPLATYSNQALTSANANPVVLDSAGRATVFLSAASYKFTLNTAAGALVKTTDNIAAVPFVNVDLDVQGVAGEALTAGKVAYMSDGSGSLTAGRWYLADADLQYSSTTAKAVGMVVADIALAATGSIRLVGRMTGLTSLTAGTLYYVSATAGGLTATAPSNARPVGVADSTTSLILGQAVERSIRQIASIEATVGNVGTGEDILASYSAPAGELGANGMSWRAIFWGKTASNANAKTLRARTIEGGNNTIIVASTLTVSEAGEWLLGFEVKRTGATTARAAVQVVGGPGNSVSTYCTTRVTQPTITFANAVELRVSGEATATNDITVEGGTVTLVTI